MCWQEDETLKVESFIDALPLLRLSVNIRSYCICVRIRLCICICICFCFASEECFIDAALLLLESWAVNMRSSQLSEATALCGYHPVSNGWADPIKSGKNNLAKTHQEDIRLLPMLGRSHMKPLTQQTEIKILGNSKVLTCLVHTFPFSSTNSQNCAKLSSFSVEFWLFVLMSVYPCLRMSVNYIFLYRVVFYVNSLVGILALDHT